MQPVGSVLGVANGGKVDCAAGLAELGDLEGAGSVVRDEVLGDVLGEVVFIAEGDIYSVEFSSSDCDGGRWERQA